MAAVRRRVCQLSSIPGFGASKPKVSSSSSSLQRAILDPFPVSGARHCSQLAKSNGKHLFFVDTLALVRRLEGEGVPSKQADAIIAATTEVLKDSLENVSQSFVSKGEMRKIEMMQESNLSKFKAELQSSQAAGILLYQTDPERNVPSPRGHHQMLSLEDSQTETEKLGNDVEKRHIELRHDIDKVRREIDKVTAGQRSDFNLEMGKIREELSKQKAETNILTNKLDGVSDNMTSKLDELSDNMTSKLNGGMDSLRAQLEAAKYDSMKYFMGTIVSIATVGVAVLRLSM